MQHTNLVGQIRALFLLVGLVSVCVGLLTVSADSIIIQTALFITIVVAVLLASTRGPSFMPRTVQTAWYTFIDSLHVDTRAIPLQKIVDGVRILLGFIIIYMYADSFSYATLLSTNIDGTLQVYTLAIIIGVALLLGVVTPLTCLTAFIFVVISPPEFPFGLLLARIVLIGLLFLGAGRSLSVDATLKRQGSFTGIYQMIYRFIPPLTAEIYVRVRILLLALFWGVNLTAARGHLEDTYWVSGDALVTILTTPYFTDWYPLFAEFQTNLPSVFFSLAVVALILQTVYELLTLPLCFSKIGRGFVAFQFLGFCLVLYSVLNEASQVATMQLAIWLLVFLPELWLIVQRRFTQDLSSDNAMVRTDTQSNESAISESVVSKMPIYTLLLFFALLSVVAQTILIFSHGPERIYRNPIITHSLNIVGQLPAIDVFNALDIEQSTLYMVVVEMSSTQEIERVTPWTDYYGGRLDYQATGYAHYAMLNRWQRLPTALKYNADTGELSTRGQQFFLQQIAIDRCMRRITATSTYYALLFHRPITQHSLGDTYTADPELISVTQQVVPTTDTRTTCYNVPLNHFFSDERRDQTHQKAQSALSTYLNDNNAIFTIVPDAN